jgi:hypothetical protein
MADELRIGLSGLLRKAQMESDAEFLKEGVRVLSQALMEMEVFAHQKKARMPEAVRRQGGSERKVLAALFFDNLVLLRTAIWAQPQRDVLRLYRLPYHSYQILS